MATSSLHEKVITIIEMWLKGLMPGYEMLCKDGRYRTHEQLMDGVDIIRVPDDKNDLLPVGGIRSADITLLDKQANPVRIIEVEVTSPIPERNKEMLEKRGVDVVEVKVQNEAALLNETFRLRDDGFKVWFRVPGSERKHNIPATQAGIRRVHNADNHIKDILESLRWCSPEMRRRLSQVLNALETIDSFYPTPR